MTIAALIHNLEVLSHTLEGFAQVFTFIGYALTLLQFAGIL
jgi:hypothetical protein